MVASPEHTVVYVLRTIRRAGVTYKPVCSPPEGRPMAKVTRADWLDAGLDVLASEGPQALVAERLAQRLGVTRGSFYHHFRSRESFLTGLLERWSQRHTQA